VSDSRTESPADKTVSAESTTTGLPARRAALGMIDAVLRRGQRFDALAIHSLAPSDEGLARAIAGEVLRRLPDLDALIDSATAQPLPGDAKARTVLRIALVQTLVLGTPAHAAIATALPMVEGGPKRLVHGVFGTLMRRLALLPEVPTLPEAVRSRWGAAWGYAMLGDAARALAVPPPLDLTLRDADEDGGIGGEQIWTGQRRLPRGHNVADLPGFSEGSWWVQNVAAAIPARLLGDGAGRTVLDLCAAPGGKTMQLAAAGWRVVAVEQHAKRAERLRENLSRTRLNAEVAVSDVMAWEPTAPADAILLDAPCSATGIFARHPDVLHRIGPKDISALAGLQTRMLARAADWLTPTGRLVYATCSLEPDEGEKIVAASSLVIDPVAAEELPPGIVPAAEGWVRVLPVPGRDGFFIARLKRA
jgi:16S rRNA (cytosine967-C5)-methyltransferase